LFLKWRSEEKTKIKDYVEQITPVMFPDLFQTRTTNNKVFGTVESTMSKIVKNSSEVMSKQDGAWRSCTDYAKQRNHVE
jgi:surface antigen